MERKVVYINDPLGQSAVDITDFRPVIDTEIFQKSRFRKQLSLIHLVYPSATHTRFEHMLGTLQRARAIAPRVCAEKEEKEFLLTALIHDIGHGPYSHAVENAVKALGGPDHDKIAKELLSQLQDEIEQICSYEEVLKLFKKKNPLWQAVWSIIGADKLDYLARDGNACGQPFAIGAINEIMQRVDFKNEKYCIEEKTHVNVKEFLISWWAAHEKIYLRKACRITEACLITAIYYWVNNSNFEFKNIFSMTDNELDYNLITSNGISKKMMLNLQKREMPKLFLSFKIKGYENDESIRKKSIKVVGLEKEELEKNLDKFNSAKNIVSCQEEIEKLLGCEPGNVVIDPMANITRLEPPEIYFLNTNTDELIELKELNPNLVKLLESDRDKHYAFRVCTLGSREKAYEKSKEIEEIIKHSF